MKTIGNILWFILCGAYSAFVYFLLGVILCITIIGIPFGKQCFKLAGLYVWPFGKKVESNFGKHPVGNIIWFILGGFIFALVSFIAAIILFVTIIGIPFGLQAMKLAKLSAFPFGAVINKPVKSKKK